MSFVIITGGIGAGKSYISEYIREELNKTVIDCDSLAKNLMKRGNICYNEIVSKFGERFLDECGELSKAKLSKFIYENESNRKKLNDIVHPIVKKYIVDKYKDTNEIIFIETAIAYTANLLELGKIIYVYAEKEDRINRLNRERGLSRSHCESIIKAQEVEEYSKKIADYIIDNSDGKNPIDRIKDIVMEIEDNETL